MGFRAKMKRTFTGGNKSGDNSPTDPSTPKIPGIEYYKPNEVPRSKYRGNGDKAHQERLHAFSFADAFKNRRHSGTSSYSPTGTKAQSRRASYFSKSSLKSEVDGTSLRRKSTNPGPVKEDADDDGDVANVGVSRPTTAHKNDAKDSSDDGLNDLHQEMTITQGATPAVNETPFTAEELTRAMTAARLEEKAL